MITIGSPASDPRTGGYYGAVRSELDTHASVSLAGDIPWLAEAVYNGYRHFITVPFTENEAVYWNGRSFEKRPWPDEKWAWSTDCEAFTDKIERVVRSINEPLTIIDVGCGLGTLTFHIIARNIPGLRYVNIDLEPAALSFGEEFSRRHGLDVQYVRMNLAAGLSNPSEMKELRAVLGNGPKVLVDRESLYPNFTAEQCALLFRFLVDEDTRAGVHLSLCGFRTEAYKRAAKNYHPAFMVVKYKDDAADPHDYLTEHTGELGITITERQDIWPHYQYLRMPTLSHWPSFLSWGTTQ